MSSVQLSVPTKLDQIQNFYLNCGLEKSYPFEQGQRTSQEYVCIMSLYLCRIFSAYDLLNAFYIFVINIFNLALQAVAFINNTSLPK